MGDRSATVERSSEPLRGERLRGAFFDRPTERVAWELLGVELSVRAPEGWRTVRIVETEAYVGNDPANHAYRGPTERNRSMFGPPGTLYVYRIHRVVCANIVTRRGEAVLLRAGAPLTPALSNTSGPGRLCRALGLTLADDGADVAKGERVALAPGVIPRGPIVLGPRVGIRRAADRRLRFAIRDDPFVSRPRVGPNPPANGASPKRSPDAGARRRSRTTRRPASADGRRGGRTGGK
jgi:DNA-3-methyladenine glycosylase